MLLVAQRRMVKQELAPSRWTCLVEELILAATPTPRLRVLLVPLLAFLAWRFLRVCALHCGVRG